jgi:hypothetical protein
MPAAPGGAVPARWRQAGGGNGSADEEERMSTRSDYTDEEWQAVRRTPAEAAIAMEQASPSGFLGRRRERKAQERSFAAAISTYAGLGLVDAIIAAAEEEGPLVEALRSAAAPVIEDAIAHAGAARRAIRAKGTADELEAYVNTVLGACEVIAAADREGDVAALSAGEALLLQRLAAALGRPDYTPGRPDFAPPGQQKRVIMVGIDDTDTEQGLGQQRR